MLNFEEACEMAVKFFESKNKEGRLTSAKETDELYIFYYGIPNMMAVGDQGISINKNTKEIKMFILPNKENFEILKTSKDVPLPVKYEG